VFLKWPQEKAKNRESLVKALLNKNIEVVLINNEDLDPYVSISEEIKIP
jgi:hypothetical protein